MTTPKLNREEQDAIIKMVESYAKVYSEERARRVLVNAKLVGFTKEPRVVRALDKLKDYLKEL